MNFELVCPKRDDTSKPLLLLEQRRFYVYKFGLENRLNFRFNFVELKLSVGIDCDVESNIKELFLGLLDCI